ncbi:hypothetical protein [Nonomuraea cavernae]|uniref:Uncharacterized protein n=1 Tax=Nonomuraea cavernae TaxID=2045107 RepID=A0A918DKX9_9ACTN|nr:hypothetical protein [Nonomuraea cavernae]MCA2188145.1 hypothetical protein [Nonomuraea cavernae]GGO72926.1 hypothetical protein GCM10012289_42170 [Nonomuraea cavernae]
MLRTARRVLRDVRERRNIDAYVIALLSVVFAALTLVGDRVDDQYKWAVLLAGIGVLVHRITVPDAGPPPGHILGDRTSLQRIPLKDRLKASREVWMFAPSGVNLLSEDHCAAIRTTVLNRHDGVVKVVILDPGADASLGIATLQLDGGLEFPLQSLADSIATTLLRMDAMASWQVPGRREFRLFGYNPGFSLVAFDPGRADGTVIVEMHGVGNTSTPSRMHLELTRQTDPHWYQYWLDQFGHIWRASKPVGDDPPPADDGR